MLGQLLNERYQIISQLGRGGFGETYLACDRHLPGHPQCVVKQLKPRTSDPVTLQTAKRLFDTEAEVLYTLGNHPQIPRLFAHFEENQEFYLVQELIDGHSLTKEFPSGQRLSEDTVVTLLQEILEVLEFVHQQQVIHRDLKPSNLIRRHSDGKIVLIDFGAVKQISASAINGDTQVDRTIAIGSLGYMPNEQLLGNPRFSSDIYAVGIMGIQALTGLSPKQLQKDDDESEIIWHDKAEVSRSFAYILDKMVRYDFRQRYQSATSVLTEFKNLSNYQSGLLISPSRKRNPSKKAAQNRNSVNSDPTLNWQSPPQKLARTPIRASRKNQKNDRLPANKAARHPQNFSSNSPAKRRGTNWLGIVSLLLLALGGFQIYSNLQLRSWLERTFSTLVLNLNALQSEVSESEEKLPIQLPDLNSLFSTEQGKQAKAIAVISLVSQQQLMFYSEHQQFAESIDDLELQLETETDAYSYKILKADHQQATITATAKQSDLKSYTGIVVMAGQPAIKICESNNSSMTAPRQPKITGHDIQCPRGSSASEDSSLLGSS